MKTLRIVGIGGGTGLPILLAGLAGRPGVDVSGIVSVADSGGSSGRLRDDFAIPAVGDLRNCLVALSDQDSELAELFQHRFAAGGLDGHSLGNLIVTALYQRTGSLTRALEFAGEMLRLHGRAIASTEVAATLCAELQDGRTIRGESEITKAAGRIDRVWLEPESPPPSTGALEAIRSADAIVLAPGSLYTSLLPNLLVDGLVSAIQKSTAARILICNIMTQPGETDNFSAADHLREVRKYLNGALVHFCLVNSETPQTLNRYMTQDQQLVKTDAAEIVSLGATPIQAKLLHCGEGPRLLHHPEKLGHRVVCITKAWAERVIRPERSVNVMKQQVVFPIQAIG